MEARMEMVVQSLEQQQVKPRLEIVYRRVEELIPYVNNARLHPDSQIKQLAGSIREFDFNQPILIDPKDTVIAGHARLMAAKLAGLFEVPTIQITHLDATRQKAYILADNRIAMDAEWDNDLLKIETMTLRNEGFDLALAGFNDDDLKRLDAKVIEPSDGLTDPDAMPESKAEPISKEGDVWVLGNHRLMCSDSTFVDSVMKLMADNKPVLMVTDPPYGVNYDPEWREGADLGVGERSIGKVKNDNQMDWTGAYSLYPGDVAYVWHAGVFSPDVASHLRDCGFDLISQIIWVKQHFALSRGDYHWQHEPCWYVVKKGKNHNWQGARDQATTWQIKNNNSFGNADKEKTWGHGTQKPIDCMLRPIENNSANGDWIYDPFGDSGTTMIAAEKSGRRCLMMEIDPVYCDTIIRRWQEFSGKEAILESNGRTFKECSNV